MSVGSAGEGRPVRSLVASPTTSPPGLVKTCKEITCSRSVELDLVRFTWNIENFSWYRDPRGQNFDVLESPHFSTDDGQFDWVLRLIIHPRPDRPADELCRDSVQIFLHLHNAPRETANLKCQFVFVRLLNGNKEDLTYQISRTREFRRGETWGFRRFIQRSTLFEHKNGFLQNCDRLTVKINLDIIRGVRDDVQRLPRVPTSDSLEKDYCNLLQTAPHADVVFVTQDGEEVKAHKGLLAARSPVFAAMFSHNMEEKKNNRIEISDTPKNVLDTFLSLLYTGTSEHLDEHAKDVLDLAERYQMKGLKDKAVETLRNKLSASNAAEVLPLADLFNVPDLREEVIEFMVTHHEQIRDSKAYKDFVVQHPLLLAELYDRRQMGNSSGTSRHKRARIDTDIVPILPPLNPS